MAAPRYKTPGNCPMCGSKGQPMRLKFVAQQLIRSFEGTNSFADGFMIAECGGCDYRTVVKEDDDAKPAPLLVHELFQPS